LPGGRAGPYKRSRGHARALPRISACRLFVCSIITFQLLPQLPPRREAAAAGNRPNHRGRPTHTTGGHWRGDQPLKLAATILLAGRPTLGTGGATAPMTAGDQPILAGDPPQKAALAGVSRPLLRGARGWRATAHPLANCTRNALTTMAFWRASRAWDPSVTFSFKHVHACENPLRPAVE
jgi:hypothetical protein